MGRTSKYRSLNLPNLQISNLQPTQPPKNRTEPRTLVYVIRKNRWFFEDFSSKPNLEPTEPLFWPQNRTTNLLNLKKPNEHPNRTRFDPTLVQIVVIHLEFLLKQVQHLRNFHSVASTDSSICMILSWCIWVELIHMFVFMILKQKWD